MPTSQAAWIVHLDASFKYSRHMARFLRRDSVSSIAYSEELISDTMSATLQSTDRHYGIVDQEPDHFQLDS